MGPTNPAAERTQHLAFSVAGGDYALSLVKVREILQYEAVTKIPSAPRSIRGVISLRGRVVPVVDLAVKLRLDESAITRHTCILVVEVALPGASGVMGIVADAVSEVIELGADDVDEPPAFGTDARVDCVVGMGRVGRRLVLLLDVDRAIAAGEA